MHTGIYVINIHNNFLRARRPLIGPLSVSCLHDSGFSVGKPEDSPPWNHSVPQFVSPPSSIHPSSSHLCFWLGFVFLKIYFPFCLCHSFVFIQFSVGVPAWKALPSFIYPTTLLVSHVCVIVCLLSHVSQFWIVPYPRCDPRFSCSFPLTLFSTDKLKGFNTFNGRLVKTTRKRKICKIWTKLKMWMKNV